MSKKDFMIPLKMRLDKKKQPIYTGWLKSAQSFVKFIPAKEELISKKNKIKYSVGLLIFEPKYSGSPKFERLFQRSDATGKHAMRFSNKQYLFSANMKNGSKSDAVLIWKK